MKQTITPPQHWQIFIQAFQDKFDTEIVYEFVRVFQTEDEIKELYTTYEFEEYLPNYIPIADDSGGQVAVISKDENNTKVYLTSYGTLIESDLKTLDHNLLHWMSRAFPFGNDEFETISSNEEQLSSYILEREKLQTRVNKFPILIDFFANTVEIENLCMPENYPSLDTIFDFQDGYAYNSVSNQFLFGEKEGDFKENWLVIATNYFADPFFIDFNEFQENFPVYFAYHGAGKWFPIKISNSLKDFQQKLKSIHQHRFDKEQLKKIVENEDIIANKFWKEVFENIQNIATLTETEITEKQIQTDWREAELYIISLGPNKMKIVSLLKDKFNLTGAEALQMSKKDKILYHQGLFKWMKSSIQELENLGASVEIVML